MYWDGKCCPKCGSPHTESYPDKNWCADCGHSWNIKKEWWKSVPNNASTRPPSALPDVDVSQSGRVSVVFKKLFGGSH
jgi:uncharacterized Zn finger protein (UPF0148 family)